MLEDVTVGFNGLRIIDQLSVVFDAGKLTALVGPSGSGKTTVLGLVAGNIRPQGGRVIVNFDSGISSSPKPSYIAWVPQGGQMLPGRTVVDNTMVGPLSEGWPLSVARSRAERAMELVEIRHLANVKARTLSGGEAQRLAFARAVATTRPVILADEPTANLDRSSASKVIDVLFRLQRDRTVIVATHDEAVVDSADAVVRLGRLDARR